MLSNVLRVLGPCSREAIAGYFNRVGAGVEGWRCEYLCVLFHFCFPRMDVYMMFVEKECLCGAVHVLIGEGDSPPKVSDDPVSGGSSSLSS